jgi:hypothetical protein
MHVMPLSVLVLLMLVALLLLLMIIGVTMTHSRVNHVRNRRDAAAAVLQY